LGRMLIDVYKTTRGCDVFYCRHTNNTTGYGNIMYDRRVIRGSTYAQRVLPAVTVVS